jgi:transposase
LYTSTPHPRKIVHARHEIRFGPAVFRVCHGTTIGISECLDQGDTGSGEWWTEEHPGWTVEIVQHAPAERGGWQDTRDEQGKPRGTDVRFAPEPTEGFKAALPREWCVERTFSRLGQSRRRSRDEERRPETEEALIDATVSRIMLKRLAVA